MSESSESSDYTKDQIIAMCKGVKDVELFYQQKFINYRGPRSKNKKRYTEIIACWVINHLEMFEQIGTICRESSYYSKIRDGRTNNPDANSEKQIAIRMYKQEGGIPGLGTIIDYQTPLKNKESDKVGEIDLLAFDEKNGVLRLLELKVPNSKETMLRCVLEAYTYLRLVDREKLIQDFNCGKQKNIPLDTPIVACPFIYRRNSKGENGAQYQEMQEDRPKLRELMKLLEIKPLVIEENKPPYSAYELEL